MHLLLLAIGVLVTAVGVVMIAFSVPLTDLAGVALFTSGMIAAVGGFILIGLSAAVRSLSRIAERLDIQPLPLPSVVAIEHEAPPPRPIRTTPEPPVASTASVSEAPKAPEGPKPGDAPKAAEEAPAMSNPETTARIVANAIDEMKAKKTFPARACASKGALMFVPPCPLMKSGPTIVAAPNPRNVVMM